jgi:SPP1 gp7 family putative phage head morphogenesis protein
LIRARSTAEKAYQNKFTRVVTDARREQIAKVEAHGSMFGNGQKAVSEALVFSLNPFKNKLKSAYRQVTTSILPEAVQQANNEIRPIAPSPVAGSPSAEVSPWKMPPEKALRFIEQRENVMAGIADDIHRGIMEIIQEGMNKQLGATETANLIRAKFNEISNGRAKTIARTETGAAYGFSREEAMKAAGIRYKEWLSTPDDRCRETHKAADGQVVEMDSPFQCDPAGPPEEIINCRCVQIAVSQP